MKTSVRRALGPTWALMGLMLVGAAGCEETLAEKCESSCERHLCGADFSCSGSCSNFNEDMECAEEYDALFTCLLDAPVDCDNGVASCIDEGTALTVCQESGGDE